MTLTPNYGFVNDYAEGSAVSAADLDRRAKVVDDQVNLAAGCIGKGVLEGFLVSEGAGLQVHVSAGKAVVYSTDFKYTVLQTIQITNVGLGQQDDIPDNAVSYLFVAINTPDPYSPIGTTKFRISDLSTLDGGELLAKITTVSGAITEIVDKRTLPSTQSIIHDLIGVGRVVGADISIDAPSPEISPSADIFVPEGAVFIIGTQRIVIPSPGLSIPVPDSADGDYYGFLSVDPDTNLPNITADHIFTSFPSSGALATLHDDGYPCIGKFTFLAGVITVVDATAVGHADLIYTQAGILYLISTVPTGGDSGLAARLTAVENTLVSVLARLTALEEASGTGVTTVPLNSDKERIRRIMTTNSAVETDPTDFDSTYPGTINKPGYTGNGEVFDDGNVAPNNVVGGDCVRDDLNGNWK